MWEDRTLSKQVVFNFFLLTKIGRGSFENQRHTQELKTIYIQTFMSMNIYRRIDIKYVNRLLTMIIPKDIAFKK